ncbi:Brain-specific serine protease 4, partial [Folsomia candida]
DPPPRLPGPSIFDYRNEVMMTLRPQQQQHSVSTTFDLTAGNSKVKRGHEQDDSSSSSSSSSDSNLSPQHHPQQYFELAGDQLLVFEPSPMEASPGDWSAENNFGDDDGGVAAAECVSANEKDGQCAPFHLCYPVVFNAVTGELRNHGLARMLYQASGPCAKNESWSLQTVSVQVQPGVVSHVPLEIPSDFYNHTVCCPGYFYFENTIPHHYSPPKGGKSSPPLKPSHPDPMLPPTLRHEGRSFPSPQDPFYIGRHPHRHRHNHPLPIQQMSLPPPHQILLHPHEMFDSDLSPPPGDEEENVENDGQRSQPDYYFDEFSNDFDSSYYTTHQTPTTTSTTTSTTTPSTTSSTTLRPLKRRKTTPQPANSTLGDGGGAESKRVKVVSGRKNSTVSASSAATKGGTTEGGKGGTTSTKKRTNKISSSKAQGGIGNHKVKSEPLPPVVIEPPHLSAWNCPGRTMTMPRGHWPWMVALLNEGSHFCSGSLIDHRHILTSASCVASIQGTDIGKMRVILGDRVLYSSIDGPHLWRKIVRITRHIQYNSESMPINLPSSSNKGHTDKAIVSGWSGADLGKRFFSPRPAVDSVVEFMDREDCHKRFEGFKSEKSLPDDIICRSRSPADDEDGQLLARDWHLESWPRLWNISRNIYRYSEIY